MADEQDQIVVFSGRTTRVSTLAMSQMNYSLTLANEAIEGWIRRLNRSDWGYGVGGNYLTARDSGGYVAQAAQALQHAHRMSEDLAEKIRIAAERYADAEHLVVSRTEQVAAAIATMLGFILLWSPWARLLAPGIVLGLFVGLMIGTKGDPAGWLARNKRILSNPRFISLLRVATASTDNFVLTALGIPPLVVQAHDDSGTGILGQKSVARGAARVFDVLGIGSTDVVVQHTMTTQADPPKGMEEMIERIPPAVNGEPQIRIEEYTTNGESTFVVYLAGTVSSVGLGSDQPNDMNANVELSGGEMSASLAAAINALEKAGAQPGDKILPVGFSQGGLIAAGLAKTEGYDTVGVVTAGAPVASLDLPTDAPVISFEFFEDPVPALGGIGATGEERLANHTIYRTSNAERVASAPDDNWVPAHNREDYAEFSGRVGGPHEPNTASLRESMARLLQGEATVTTWTSKRVEDPD